VGVLRAGALELNARREADLDLFIEQTAGAVFGMAIMSAFAVGVDAGIPPVSTCWGCHQVITGRNAPQEVAKILEYLEDGESIPWVRIYKISDHAHFPHMRHINAGLACQQCHGEVQTMGVLEERDPVWGGNNMGWCIDCHRDQNATKGTKAPLDCVTCHH